jgi:hypothetical protein
VIVVPVGCGEGRLGVIEIRAGGLKTTYEIVACACGASVVMPWLRTHTLMRASGMAVFGVQLKYGLEPQSCTVVNDIPPSVDSRHL